MQSSSTKKPHVLAENGHEDDDKLYDVNYEPRTQTEIILCLSAKYTYSIQPFGRGSCNPKQNYRLRRRSNWRI